MRRIILACALAGIFATPANALDGISPPAVVPPPIVVPAGQHNSNLQRAAKELLEQAAQLRRGGTELLAQANPGGASLREQLVGVWALTSCNARLPWCAKPGGLMILDASGYYTIVHVGLDRAKLANPQPREAIPAEEYKRIAMGVQVNFGTWSVDEAGKTLTWHIQGGLIPNVEGNNFKGDISLSGDELKLAPAQTWRRLKK